MSHRLVFRRTQWVTASLPQWSTVASGVHSAPIDVFNRRSFSLSSPVTQQTQAKALPQLSYLHGASRIPLLGVTIGQRIEWAAERVPEREAIVFCKRNVRLTFAQYLQQVPANAATLCIF